jgi:hypothetical protein
LEPGVKEGAIASGLAAKTSKPRPCTYAGGVVVQSPIRFGGGVAPGALDPGNAERLGDIATDLLK